MSDTVPKTLQDPVLGILVYDDGLEAFAIPSRSLAALNGSSAAIVIYDIDSEIEAPKLRAAVRSFLDATKSWLEQAEPYVQEYRADFLARSGEHSELSRTPPVNIWSEVSIGPQIVVSRQPGGAFTESGIYFDLECNCEWDPEHGLQIVFRDGKIARVADYSGHLTNAGASADASLLGVIYERFA